MVKFPNPPLDEIKPEHLLTTEDAAERFHVQPVTIRLWVHRGLIEAVPLGAGGKALYHLSALAEAEYATWQNGANRTIRGGRHPGWRPGHPVAA